MIEYHKAIFLEEGKHRFLCTVLHNGIKKECYVSSSSKLSKYLQLNDCEVLLSENKGNNLRTDYTLEAVKNNNIFFYVNFNGVNKLYEKYLYSENLLSNDICRERILEDKVKVDFFIKEHGCIEVKSLLSDTGKIIFPDVSSHRLRRQLLQYLELLKAGISVTFSFVAMSSSLVNFEWSAKKIDEKELFLQGVKLGMKIKAFVVVYICGEFKIVKNALLEEKIINEISSY